MSTTSLLSLPYLAAGQAQKHVTVNEALRMLDVLVQLSVKSTGASTPPATPAEGERHLIGNAPTGAWAGQASKIAAFQDGAWVFFAPRAGWVAWQETTGFGQLFNGTDWISAAGAGPTTLLGVNATADTTNRLSVNAPASLFNHEGTDHRLKINKNAAANTASLLFQTGFSGRAEMGIAGDDRFQIKVSANGSTFQQALVAETDGRIRLPRNPVNSYILSGASSAALAANVWIPVTSTETVWSEVVASPASMFNITSGIITISAPGIYRLSGLVTFLLGASLGTCYVSIWRNNSFVNGSAMGSSAAAANGHCAVQTEVVLNLNAGDTLNLRVFVSVAGVRLANGGFGSFNAQFLA